MRLCFQEAMADSHLPKPHVYEAEIPLPSVEFAAIAVTALSVDEELRPALVDRTITSHGSSIILRVAASDARALRTSVVSLLDFLLVSLSTLAAFADMPENQTPVTSEGAQLGTTEALGAAKTTHE